MTPPEVLISDLDIKYQEIEKETQESPFYVSLANYGKYLLEHEETKAVLAPLYEESGKDIVSYREAWQDFMTKWRDLAADLVGLADKEGIEDDPNNLFHTEITSLKNHLDEQDFIAWESDIQDYFNPYRSLIWKFIELGKEKSLPPKHLDKNDKAIPLGGLYDRAYDEWQKYKLYRQTTVWWAHYQIERLTAGILNIPASKDYFKEDNLIDGFYKMEFNELARGGRSTPMFLRKDKFLLWLKRLHNYLLPRLKITGNSGAPQAIENQSNNITPIRNPENWQNILMAIWSLYEAHSRPDSLLVPVDRLTSNNRSVEIIDKVIDDIKKEGCYANWERKDRWYSLNKIDHKKFPELFNRSSQLFEESPTNKFRPSEPIPDFLKWRDLVLDFNQQTVRYKNGIPHEVSFATKPLGFLRLLFEHPRVMSYVEIAQCLGLNSYQKGDENKDVSRDVQALRRNLMTFLGKTIKVDKNDLADLVVTIERVGYKIGQE